MNKQAAITGKIDIHFGKRFTHMLDPKRRLSIPTSWRSMILGESRRILVLPNDRDRCLNAFSFEDPYVQEKLRKFHETPSKNVQGRHFARTLSSRMDVVTMDAQGRVRIDEELLKFAGLEKQVELVGAGNRMELWSPDRWVEQYIGTDGDHFQEASDYFGF